MVDDKDTTEDPEFVFPARVDLFCKLLNHGCAQKEMDLIAWANEGVLRAARFQQTDLKTIAMIPWTIRMIDICQKWSPQLIGEILAEQERMPWPLDYLQGHIVNLVKGVKELRP